ncbi:MAG: restriction endonuclease subunit M [Bacteroides sp.]|nr:restriction endonuclease subunit M [Bacteroides sp.]
MKTVLHKFITEPLFDATEAILTHLQIHYTSQSKTPLSFHELYTDTTSSSMPQALKEVVAKVNNTYLIGAIDEDTLEGRQSDFDIDKPLDGKYNTMIIFAVDIKQGYSLTRGELATLTRGFNRMAPQLPVIVFIKNGDSLSLATCERSEYCRAGMEGEKLGKVSILRDINCADPHRGHIDILESLGDKVYPTFDELYKHWLEVFSSELLTKKFYTELSEWFAWVIGSGKVKFPNDISTTEDDTKFNHEAVIRLITRLIFVWFLRQKKLIPEDFFNEKAIRGNFIENFDPHSSNTLFYNPEESKYYRLILQNLFFAMLNRPITDEESGIEENRRFATAKRFRGVSQDFNINNLMRYQAEFRPGGADRLLKFANSCVPFLNGGLFECLDHKDKEDPEYGKYYDGFSENIHSLEQLSFPDYFFFANRGDFVADLSDWYDDDSKDKVLVRGIVSILHNYNFTIEENTPLDQEVSLDPELLGKVFENLLASYNPETNKSARKQTGSFYTPRHIVNYMVEESLISHLIHNCPDIHKDKLRDLFSYTDDNFKVTDNERKQIMSALYNCKVLDPACGSGAFPMGILQQMVHALRKLDPTNEMWREFILDISLQKDKEAYQIEDENERKRLRADIEQSFNRQVNDPDYARKLYLIENCIYGVDIQPIATQISKLRFFISLVAEQKPTNDASKNFGIRPLPNLEAKFVSANSLQELKKSNDLFSNSEGILKLKRKLADANHRIFLAKSNKQKRILKQVIKSIRSDYAEELTSLGIVKTDGASMLANWNQFDQNSAAEFLDLEWMFDITDGFDIIIGNPPYVEVLNSDAYIEYETYTCYELYAHFFERAVHMLKNGGILAFITGSLYIKGMKFQPLRDFLRKNTFLLAFRNEGDNVFEEVGMPTSTILLSKQKKDCLWPFDGTPLILKLTSSHTTLGKLCDVQRGLEIGKKAILTNGDVKILTGTNVKKYVAKSVSYISFDTLEDFAKDAYYYEGERLVIRETGSELTVTYLDYPIYVNRSLYTFKRKPEAPSVKFLVGCLNSKLLQYFYIEKFKAPTELFPKIRIGQAKQLPIPIPTKEQDFVISSIVDDILQCAQKGEIDSALIDKLNRQIYLIYGLSYEDVLIIDPDTTITEEKYNNSSKI